MASNLHINAVKSFTMKNSLKVPLLLQRMLFFFFLLVPTLAQAHPQIGYSTGFVRGMAHPLTGLDHICAMIAVGLWAVQRGGRALWFVPLTFVSVMILGGIVGMAKIPIPWVEPGIAASVLILGLLIAAAVRLPLWASMVLVGLFAFFHGHAHGWEMPVAASGMLFGLGFIVSTIALHACGIGLGLAAKRTGSVNFIRYAGGAIAACGIYLCATVQ
jgi:urease accessory protein